MTKRINIRLHDGFDHPMVDHLARRTRPLVPTYIIDLDVGIVRGKGEIAAPLFEHFESFAKRAHCLLVGFGIKIARQKRGFVQLRELVENYLRVAHPILGVEREVRRTVIVIGQLHDQKRPRFRAARQRHSAERQRLLARQHAYAVLTAAIIYRGGVHGIHARSLGQIAQHILLGISRRHAVQLLKGHGVGCGVVYDARDAVVRDLAVESEAVADIVAHKPRFAGRAAARREKYRDRNRENHRHTFHNACRKFP